MISQFRGAVMNEDRTHRFLLWNFWDSEPRMLFIGLNPSTANEVEDDPTIHRLCDFAQKWGYGGLYACNLYSQVTPYPEELKLKTALHPANIPAIQMAVGLSKLTVCGWGDGIEKVAWRESRVHTVWQLLSHPYCFGLTKSGNPKHPLYLPGDSKLESFQ